MTLDEMSLFDGAPFPKPKTETVKPKTNADRIRQMTDEELAVFIHESICPHATCGFYSCETCALQWLRKEVSEDAGTD